VFLVGRACKMLGNQLVDSGQATEADLADISAASILVRVVMRSKPDAIETVAPDAAARFLIDLALQRDASPSSAVIVVRCA
jgi:hypothetical protein